MKELSIIFSSPMVRAIIEGRKTVTRRICKPQPVDMGPWPVPKYEIGDRLWVRETWRTGKNLDALPPRMLATSDPILYAADHATRNLDKLLDFGGWSDKWRTPIFMPRWASRLTLEVVSVRVERLHDITDADAVAEGVNWVGVGTPRDCFAALWMSIHGPDSWATSHWVWRVEFRKVEP